MLHSPCQEGDSFFPPDWRQGQAGRGADCHGRTVELAFHHGSAHLEQHIWKKSLASLKNYQARAKRAMAWF